MLCSRCGQAAHEGRCRCSRCGGSLVVVEEPDEVAALCCLLCSRRTPYGPAELAARLAERVWRDAAARCPREVRGRVGRPPRVWRTL